MKIIQSLHPTTYKFALKMLKIASKAVRETQEENRRLGLANVYEKNGKIYYELPNGEITTENPLNTTTNA